MGKLIVKKAKDKDVYKDIVRIGKDKRKDDKGRVIKEGSVCEIISHECSDGGANKRILGRADAILRGQEDSNSESIMMDGLLREKLGKLKEDEIYEFAFRRESLMGLLRWGLNASDPSYRIASVLGIISVILGLISVTPLLLPLAVKYVIAPLFPLVMPIINKVK